MVNCIYLIIEMSPRFILGRENVPCVADVVNRSLKADCTDYTSSRRNEPLYRSDCNLVKGEMKTPQQQRIFSSLSKLLQKADHLVTVRHRHTDTKPMAMSSQEVLVSF